MKPDMGQAAGPRTSARRAGGPRLAPHAPSPSDWRCWGTLLKLREKPPPPSNHSLVGGAAGLDLGAERRQ
eukprot:7126101-Alexandrium_andersonii.AAC.2